MNSMLNWLKLFGCAALLAIAVNASAAPSGSEVVVVYNSRVPESRELAKYYAEKRGVPEKQVFGFALPREETISRLEFRDDLQKPLAAALAKQKLWRIASVKTQATTNQPSRLAWKPVESSVRYLLLCYGVPLKIAKEPNFTEDGLDKVRPEFRRDEASVDNELALLPLHQEKISRAGPVKNYTYMTTNSAHLHPTNGILMVARLDGPTPEIARGLLDKTLIAERDGLWGRGYFDLRGIQDAAYKQGDDWILGAAQVWRLLGFETLVDTNSATIPPDEAVSHVAFYAGWYTQNVDGPWARKKVEFMPGAFAYHLHSFSAATLRSDKENWVGPLLARGATISMGSVDEPYLGGTPDITAFAARLVFNAFTFGEAAYSCQNVLSWQTTVVGDPLYRPFGKDADQLHRSLESKKSPLVDWSFLRLANLNMVAGRAPAEIANMVESFDRTKQSAVLSEKLGDIYSILGKPGSALFTYQKALERDPSPMQRLRLRVVLADKLGADGKPKEAIQQLEKVLEEFPDWPRLPVFKKLLPLAQKAGDDAAAARYQDEITRLDPPQPPPATETSKAGTS